MAMQVGDAGEDDTPMSDINTTPLVDVMLVLLIIFLIAVPVVLQSVPVQLPKVDFEVTTTRPENVNLSVRAVNGQCEVYWFDPGKFRCAPSGPFARWRTRSPLGGARIATENLPERISGDINHLRCWLREPPCSGPVSPAWASFRASAARGVGLIGIRQELLLMSARPSILNRPTDDGDQHDAR